MAVASLSLVLLGACSRGDGDEPFALDGTPRIADDEGIVTAVDLESVTLDGERTYDVDRDLRSFSALDLSTVPLLYTEGQYVQVGVDGDTLEWIGTIARPLATEPPTVIYLGEVETVDDGAITFANGTVLSLDADVDVDEDSGDVRVSIDPEAHEVIEVVPA